ncbi:SDR family NAD(P)-dependent oxidoreductase [Priestia koreensis]|uniref:SDR family NAD(P)-dependent oxidoreductase n=1 Tax=Priestia koreensis TaxID=284581 RepID=UPI001F57ACED|nr:SDR family oxidoreductase [Priestia koreensis]MCM3002376.1 SDR family oxidoreductase [Priestia koreensis]UNL84101.1 SDR family oxidoreductase [Priestia koreensis]
MRELKNKVVVITGASSGIGEKVALKAAELGAKPVLIARSVDKLVALSDQIKEKFGTTCTYYQLDVGDFVKVTETFQRIIQEEKTIDILINNAGFGVFDTFYEANFSDIEKMFEVNVLGLMACTKAVLPFMMDRNSGHIINIASQAGKLATPKSSGYSASKHAVLGFTNSLRLELGKTNIAVSAVNPGPIETNFFNIADKSGTYVKNVQQFMLKSDYVADRIIGLMQKPKRELNLPRWMNMGSVLYNLFPRVADKLTGNILNRK